MQMNEALQEAVRKLGLRGVANATGRRYQAVQQWLERGLPRTEYTGETNYAELIAQACRESDPQTPITRESLLGLDRHVVRGGKETARA